MTSGLPGLWQAFLLVAVCCLAGYGLAGLAPPRTRQVLAPAIPALGAAWLVVGAHWVGLVLPYRLGGPLLAGTAIGLAGATATERWRFARPAPVDLRRAGLLLVAGVPAFPAATSLHWGTGEPGLRFPTSNHDAYFFAAVDDWFLDAPFIDEVTVPVDATGDGGPSLATPARYLETAARWGPAALESLPPSMTGGQGGDRWGSVTAVWTLLLPGAVFALAASLGTTAKRAVLAGVVAGVGVGGGGGILFSLANQNSAFVLGVPMVVLAAGSLLAALQNDRVSRREAAVTAIAVLGWFGAYFEAALAAGPLVIGVLVAQRAAGRVALRNAARVAGAAVVLGPVIVVNGVRGALFLGGVDSPWPNRYWPLPWQILAGRLVGSEPLDAIPVVVPAPDWREAATVVLAFAWSAGLLFALRDRAARAAIVAVLAISVPYWLVTVRGIGDYVPNRVVEQTVAITMVLVVIGAVRACRASRYSRVLAPVMVAASILSAVAGVSVTRETAEFWTVARSIDAETAEAVSWIRARGGPEGGRVTVATTSFGATLVLADRLRPLEDVGWASLRSDYFAYGEFETAAPPDLALTDIDALLFGTATAVEVNATWQLVELGPAGGVLSRVHGLVHQIDTEAPRWFGSAGSAALVVNRGCGAIVVAAEPAPSPGGDGRRAELVVADSQEVRRTLLRVGTTASVAPLDGEVATLHVEASTPIDWVVTARGCATG